MSMYYSGSISFFFPCKLKNTLAIHHLNQRWNRWRTRQIHRIHAFHRPLTDLMDLQCNRDENEYLLSILQNWLQMESVEPFVDDRVSPYALKCLQLAYRKNREDNLFAKNASIPLARFQIEYERGHNGHIKTEGILLYNVNADNLVGTLILVFNFNNLLPIDIILLKHILYKRLTVGIKEYTMQCAACDSCGENQPYGCVTGPLLKGEMRQTTIQSYMNEKFGLLRDFHKQLDIDFRARYSFMELTTDVPEFIKGNKILSNQSIIARDLYGILYADEGYSSVSQQKLSQAFARNLSTRNDYSVFTCFQNVLLVTHCWNRRVLCKLRHADFEQHYIEPINHIRTEPIIGRCIPGIVEEYFPAFLKSAEIHYLVNNIMTSEIEVHDKSYIYPWIFLKRLKVLWEVLYELDINRYHINGDFLEAFGINRSMEKIQKEYDNVISHSMSYFAALIAIFTLVFTILQAWK